MKTLLLRNWRNLLFVFIGVVLLFFFVPTQENFYLKNDIDYFKENSILTLFVIDFILFSPFLIILLRHVKTLKETIAAIAIYFTYLVIFFVFLKSILVGVALFINRQQTSSKVTKNYFAEYINTGSETMKSPCIYDVSKKESICDTRITDTVFKYSSSSNDTIKVTYPCGVLGIPFIENISVLKK